MGKSKDSSSGSKKSKTADNGSSSSFGTGNESGKRKENVTKKSDKSKSGPAEELVGKYIGLYWRRNKKYYNARVFDFSEKDRLHKVIYDVDDSVEEIDLKRRRYRLLPPTEEELEPNSLIGKRVIINTATSKGKVTGMIFRRCSLLAEDKDAPLEPLYYDVIYLADEMIDSVNFNETQHTFIDSNPNACANRDKNTEAKLQVGSDGKSDAATKIEPQLEPNVPKPIFAEKQQSYAKSKEGSKDSNSNLKTKSAVEIEENKSKAVRSLKTSATSEEQSESSFQHSTLSISSGPPKKKRRHWNPINSENESSMVPAKKRETKALRQGSKVKKAEKESGNDCKPAVPIADCQQRTSTPSFCPPKKKKSDAQVVTKSSITQERASSLPACPPKEMKSLPKPSTLLETRGSQQNVVNTDKATDEVPREDPVKKQSSTIQETKGTQQKGVKKKTANEMRKEERMKKVVTSKSNSSTLDSGCQFSSRKVPKKHDIPPAANSTQKRKAQTSKSGTLDSESQVLSRKESTNEKESSQKHMMTTPVFSPPKKKRRTEKASNPPDCEAIQKDAINNELQATNASHVEVEKEPASPDVVDCTTKENEKLLSATSKGGPGLEIVGKCITLNDCFNHHNVLLVLGCREGVSETLHKLYSVYNQQVHIANLAEMEWKLWESAMTDLSHSLLAKRIFVCSTSLEQMIVPYNRNQLVLFEAFVVKWLGPNEYQLLFTINDSVIERVLDYNADDWNILDPGAYDFQGNPICSWSAKNCM